YALEQSGAGGERAGLHVHLGFPEGAMALVGYACVPSAAGYAALTLIGSQGAAYVDDHDNMQIVFGASSAAATPTDEGVVALAAAVQSFFEAAATGTRTPGELGGWYEVLDVGEAVLHSLRERRVIHRP